MPGSRRSFDKSMSATSAKMARVDKGKTDTACSQFVVYMNVSWHGFIVL